MQSIAAQHGMTQQEAKEAELEAVFITAHRSKAKVSSEMPPDSLQLIQIMTIARKSLSKMTTMPTLLRICMHQRASARYQTTDICQTHASGIMPPLFPLREMQLNSVHAASRLTRALPCSDCL